MDVLKDDMQRKDKYQHGTGLFQRVLCVSDHLQLNSSQRERAVFDIKAWRIVILVIHVIHSRSRAHTNR